MIVTSRWGRLLRPFEMMDHRPNVIAGRKDSVTVGADNRLPLLVGACLICADARSTRERIGLTLACVFSWRDWATRASPI